MGIFGDSYAEKEAKRQRRAEELRQSEIRRGTNKTNWTFDNQFTPKFFAQQERDYKRFAMPQLNDQYEDAGDALTYDLARRGLTDSSVRGDKLSDLQKLFTINSQDVAAKAHDFSTKSKTNVEDARADVIQQLQVTGDSKGAASSALARADALSQPQAYSPLTDLFTSFTAGLGTQAGLERAYAAGSGVKPRYNIGLYNGNDAVKVS